MSSECMPPRQDKPPHTHWQAESKESPSKSTDNGHGLAFSREIRGVAVPAITERAAPIQGDGSPRNLVFSRARVAQQQHGRQSLSTDLIIRDIESASQLEVASYDGATFVPAPTGQFQRGTELSILIRESSAPPNRVYYWVDSKERIVRTSTSANILKRCLDHVTNTVAFCSTNIRGNALSNLTDHLLIDTELDA